MFWAIGDVIGERMDSIISSIEVTYKIYLIYNHISGNKLASQCYTDTRI
jgi:hypothetical protein